MMYMLYVYAVSCTTGKGRAEVSNGGVRIEWRRGFQPLFLVA